MPEPIDLLIEPHWLIPIEPRGVVLEDHAVAVSSGRIVDVLPAREAPNRYLPARKVVLPKQVLIPGLINLHLSLIHI